MENVVILPGLKSSKLRFNRLIRKLDSEFNVHYFSCNYEKRLSDIVNDLQKYLDRKGIDDAHFVTYSFGSVVFRKFYDQSNLNVGKLVELAPIGEGSKLLNRAVELPYSRIYMDRVCFDDEIRSTSNKKLPEDRGVVTGSRRFHWSVPLYYFVPLIMDNKDSDGLVFTDEARSGTMKDLLEVDDIHYRLPFNKTVIDSVEKYLERSAFS